MMTKSVEFLPPVSTANVFLFLAIASAVAYLLVRVSNGRANKLSFCWPIILLRGLFVLTLLIVMFNPVKVTRQQGAIEPAKVLFLLDGSESMAIGEKSASRWQNAIRKIRHAVEVSHQSAAANISLFRFGRQLRAIGSPKTIDLQDLRAKDGLGVSFKQSSIPQASDNFTNEHSVANEPDTQLMFALKQSTSRFGREPPSAIVVFSDGRASDRKQLKPVSQTFAELGVPIHVVPVGETAGVGDVAAVSLLAPTVARKQTQVVAQAFLRSYGFDGQKVELQLQSINESDGSKKSLATVSVRLEGGFQVVPIVFQSDYDTTQLELTIEEQPSELSVENNRFVTEMMIAREKIRVLYFEGSQQPVVPSVNNGITELRGPTTPLKEALSADPDIECVSIQISAFMFSDAIQGSSRYPASAADLSVFDAVIFSDVPRRTFSDEQLSWFEQWARQRGGGVCMVGGRNSFGAGDWADSPIAQVLPVTFDSEFDFVNDMRVTIEPRLDSHVHSLLKIASDNETSRKLLRQFPSFVSANVSLLPKPDLTKVLGVGHPAEKVNIARRSRHALFSLQGLRNLFEAKVKTRNVDSRDEFAAIAIGEYGKGRSLAMASPITGAAAEEFLKWGNSEKQNNLYVKFWQNAIYWLTERSSVGRRRLVAECDKRHYAPGDSITLTASAFLENAQRTSKYRLVAMIEPQSFEGIESDFSMVRWPNHVPREEAVESPFVVWGEEFEIPQKKTGSIEQYQVELPIAETLSSTSRNQALRLELTAYDGDSQVDSTSVPIQILHDPFEQQNPFPDHELLAELAAASGGEVLADGEAIGDMLKSLPLERGDPEYSYVPIWSQWWVMLLILGLISTEWCYRRWIGLA